MSKKEDITELTREREREGREKERERENEGFVLEKKDCQKDLKRERKMNTKIGKGIREIRR